LTASFQARLKLFDSMILIDNQVFLYVILGRVLAAFGQKNAGLAVQNASIENENISGCR